MAIGGQNKALAVPGRGGFATMRAIVTELSIDQGDDIQVQSTMSVQRFVFVFGRGIGDARIAGIAFADSCAGPPPGQTVLANGPVGPMLTQVGAGTGGLEQICNYFNSSRVAVSGRAYDLVLGTGFNSRWRIILHGMQITVSRPEQRLIEFVLRCKAFQ